MSRSARVLSMILLAAAAMSASVIQVTNAAGVWESAVASNPNTVGLVGATGTSSLRWGAGSPQSGFDFASLIPPNVNQVIPPSPGAFFDVGTFAHLNFQVGDNSGNGFGNLTATLRVNLNLTVDGTPAAPTPTFLYSFALEETDNLSTAPAGCPYGGTAASGGNGPGCNDRIVLTALTPLQTFTINGVQYKLELQFTQAGAPVSQFITQEFTTNNATLQGRFTAVTGVPEPLTFGLVGFGLVGLFFSRRLIKH